MADSVDAVLDEVKSKDPEQVEFHQAVEEVLGTLGPILEARPRYLESGILRRLVEPERVILFRVPWVDDQGEVRVNRGCRVEMNSAIGPYKGGLRFHPSVTLGMLKFLAFEQSLKNALTTLPMGGAKGGADFDPKGRSDGEVMRFCQSFMTELHRHIGPKRDVPAGDIGVGAREIGYLFGQYKRLANEFSGVLTGKGVDWGGSVVRPEATGWGSVYFAQEMLTTRGETLEGKRCLVSGSGTVARHTAEKLLHLGARVVALSDSDGHVWDPGGLDEEKLAFVMELKAERRGRISEFAEAFDDVEFVPADPGADTNALWAREADCAFPSATQNEIGAEDARALLKGGVEVVCEGANMPTVAEGARLFREAGILYGPGKAANAGGVAVSGLEMAQNSQRVSWSREEVDERLCAIMTDIHARCLEVSERFGEGGDYLLGANTAAFEKLADAMLDQGVV